MDPANAREALRGDRELDVDEGADILMVKPAMPCLDIVRAARERFELPLVAYQVSGEYAMMQGGRSSAAGSTGRARSTRACSRSGRAGADRIITYFAKDFARRHRG